MKKLTLYILSMLVVSAMMLSCSSDEPELPMNDCEKAVLTLCIDDAICVRSLGNTDSGSGGLTNLSSEPINFVLALYQVSEDEQGSPIYTLVDDYYQTCQNKNSVEFTPQVGLGVKYRIVAYAYFGTASDNLDLRTLGVSARINDDSADTYYASTEVIFKKENPTYSINLTRPFAKLRVVSTNKPQDEVIKQISVEYSGKRFSTFDALTGNFFGESSESVYLTTEIYPVEKEEFTIFSDYIPVNVSIEDVCDLQINEVKVTVVFESGNEQVRSFPNVPLLRNSLTTLKGNFFY